MPRERPTRPNRRGAKAMEPGNTRNPRTLGCRMEQPIRTNGRRTKARDSRNTRNSGCRGGRPPRYNVRGTKTRKLGNPEGTRRGRQTMSKTRDQGTRDAEGAT